MAHATNIRIKEDLDSKIDYVYRGLSGSILESTERGVKKGDVRIIFDELFVARYIYPKDALGLRKSEIHWSFVNKKTLEEEREFGRKILTY